LGPGSLHTGRLRGGTWRLRREAFGQVLQSSMPTFLAAIPRRSWSRKTDSAHCPLEGTEFRVSFVPTEANLLIITDYRPHSGWHRRELGTGLLYAKTPLRSGRWWLTPVILATWKAEIWRITI
jgi:hypothetical protein